VNRNQWQAGNPGTGPFGSDTDVTSAGSVVDLFRAAVAYHQAGAFTEAERLYRQMLTAFPDNADLHGRLGAVLMLQGKTSPAIPHLERAVTLKPDLFEAHGNLGQSYMAAGMVEQAVEAAARALELRETHPSKLFFAESVKHVRFTSDRGRLPKLVLRALAEGWSRPRELTGVCISLIKLNGTVADYIARANAAWPNRLPGAALRDPIAQLAKNELLCQLLEQDPLTDVGLERLLTNVRYAILATCAAGEPCDERRLRFNCSIAQQCFINEYVYATTKTEAEQAQRLRESLEKALASGDHCPVLWPVAVSAYFPLDRLVKPEALLERPWPECVKSLIVRHVSEPTQERALSNSIPLLTPIDSDISLAVRRQYEENPYPRWVSADQHLQSVALHGSAPLQAVDVLIAGCGTGLSAIEFAKQYRNARVLAVDLSRASLGYAKRMARLCGINNVEFAQADVMRLGAIEQRFDLIDASGVLHHLADPWEGWRVLLSLLRPGGSMQVGLYSEAARRNIVAVRVLVNQLGYQPTPDDIRCCREDIILSRDPLQKSVIQWEDFFTISECRDLLFHVQEHQISLPQIKSFLTENHLQFAGFNLDAPTRNKFTLRFPNPTALMDLDCWHRFETEVPGTFAAMYQFLVRKL
jgi:2-polyprenyl-3-methyl-5-hydroxy-6-metoxy-1,4-benzoquinol methylase/tetratricopeptide (TPR) repeat protein